MITGFFEFFLYLIVFISPGVLFCLLFEDKKRRDITSSIFISIVTSIAFATLLGFLLMLLGIFGSNAIRIIYGAFSIAVIGTIIWRSAFRKTTYINFRLGLIVIVFLASLMLANLLYQNAPYPRGGDANEHYVKIEQIVTDQNIPATELGLNSAVYYPRGFHVATAVLYDMQLSLPFWLVYKYFAAFLFGLLAIAAYFFTYHIFKSSRIALLASLLMVTYGSQFVLRGNLPMLLSTIYLGFLVVLLSHIFEEKRISRKNVVSLWVVFTALISTHPILLEYTLFIFAGAYITYFIFIPRHWKFLLRSGLLLVLILSLSFGTYLLLQHDLFWGQFGYTQNKIEVHDEVLGATSRLTSFTFTNGFAKFLLLYISPVLILPLIYGCITYFRKKEIDYVITSLTIFSILACSTSVLLLGRYQYILFFPLISLSAYGLWHILIKLKKIENRLSEFSIVALLFSLMLFSFSKLFFIVEYPLLGSTTPALSTSAFEQAKSIQNSGITNQTIAAVRSPATLIIEATTTNKILGADARYIDNPVYKDIAAIYDIGTAEEKLISLLNLYHINAILIDSAGELKSQLEMKLQKYFKVEFIQLNESNGLLLLKTT